MRRLKAIDWLLISTLLPLCLFGVVMTVVHGVRGDFVRLPFGVCRSPDGQYPIVFQVFSPYSAEPGALQLGDRLLRMEGDDLRGVSVPGYVLRYSQAAQVGARSLLFTIERGGVPSDVRVLLVPGYRWPGAPWWFSLPGVLSVVGIALFLLVRAANASWARRFFVAMLFNELAFTPYYWVPTAPRAWIMNGLLIQPLAVGLIAWICFEGPYADAPGMKSWERAVIWTPSLLWCTSSAAGFWLPNAGVGAVLMRSLGLAGLAFVIACAVGLARGYRHADPLGRRQLKWVLYGAYVALVPWGVSFTLGALSLFPEWQGTVFVVATITGGVAVPLGFLVAIAFYQFLDIDRLFGATLSYSVLAILGLAIVLGVMPTASRAASAALGLEPASTELLLALGLAAVVVPAYRILRPRIDRLFFPQRVALEEGFGQLLTEIASCADAQELTRFVGDRLDALLRPASAVSYARAGDAFTPIAVRGRTAPPAFAAQSALIAALQERTTPIAADRWTPRHTASLSPFERAALETLDVAVLLPIRRGPDLIAFSCIGPKRSGDIYTPTDLAWLAAVAGKISDRLLSLDATAIAEQARTMHNALQPVEGSGSEDTAQGAAGRPSETSDQGPGTNLFRKEGDYWSIAFEGCTFRLKDV